MCFSSPLIFNFLGVGDNPIDLSFTVRFLVVKLLFKSLVVYLYVCLEMLIPYIKVFRLISLTAEPAWLQLLIGPGKVYNHFWGSYLQSTREIAPGKKISPQKRIFYSMRTLTVQGLFGSLCIAKTDIFLFLYEDNNFLYFFNKKIKPY